MVVGGVGVWFGMYDGSGGDLLVYVGGVGDFGVCLLEVWYW